MQVEQILQILNWSAAVCGAFAIVFLLCAIASMVNSKAKIISNSDTASPQENSKEAAPPSQPTLPVLTPTSEEPPKPPKTKQQVIIGYVPKEARQKLNELLQLPEPKPSGWVNAKGEP